ARKEHAQPGAARGGRAAAGGPPRVRARRLRGRDRAHRADPGSDRRDRRQPRATRAVPRHAARRRPPRRPCRPGRRAAPQAPGEARQSGPLLDDPYAGRVQPRAALMIDWSALGDETVDVLRRYLMVDTTNPPGREIDGVRFLAEILAANGIASEVVEAAPERGNLMARLPGDGSLPAI